jgi:hypothetical protein
MRRIGLAIALFAAVAVVPAQAAKPAGPGSHGKGHHHGKSHKCKPHNVGWVVKGTLVSQTLVANTDGTYSGNVTVQVTHTNKHARAQQGTRSYDLVNVKVTFGEANGQPPVAGDQVKLIGKIPALAKKCDQSNLSTVYTVRKVVFNDPEAPETTPEPGTALTP